MSDLRKKIIAEVDPQGYVPKIGQTVYVIYSDCIFVEIVYSLGEKTFIVASCRANVKTDFWEWRYKDYGIKWFTTYENAEEELLSRYGEDYRLVGYESKWYEVERL